MSLGEADAKFPQNADNGSAPSPTRENPGQVYPKNDPRATSSGEVPGTGKNDSPHSTLGNPFLMNSVFEKLDHALGQVIMTIENEVSAVGGSSAEARLLEKFKSWQTELGDIRAGNLNTGTGMTSEEAPPEQEGGLFAD